ncbi:MAG TPA: response regulator [Candidatus Saccharimonadales bacterium]|nr:response regulator [Candidatus Saccharimonadales bacterium]
MNNGKKYIIVADDNKLIGKVLYNKLLAAGYEVTLTTNGQEALQAVAGRKPDLLVLDLIMPIKDGFAVLQDLRSDPATASLKVVITSDLQQAEDVERIKRLGVLGVFDKTNLQTIIDHLPQFI